MDEIIVEDKVGRIRFIFRGKDVYIEEDGVERKVVVDDNTIGKIKDIMKEQDKYVAATKKPKPKKPSSDNIIEDTVDG